MRRPGALSSPPDTSHVLLVSTPPPCARGSAHTCTVCRSRRRRGAARAVLRWARHEGCSLRDLRCPGRRRAGFAGMPAPRGDSGAVQPTNKLGSRNEDRAGIVGNGFLPVARTSLKSLRGACSWQSSARRSAFIDDGRSRLALGSQRLRSLGRWVVLAGVGLAVVRRSQRRSWSRPPWLSSCRARSSASRARGAAFGLVDAKPVGHSGKACCLVTPAFGHARAVGRRRKPGSWPRACNQQ